MISEIQGILKSKANLRTKASVYKFVPTAEKVYGVKIPELSILAKKYKNNGFSLVEKLWSSGAYEEKLLGAKILKEICKKDPAQTLRVIKNISKKISDWSVCDTLGTQSIRNIAKTKQKEILQLSKKLISSKNIWERRLALVLLVNYKKEKVLKRNIENILDKVKDDKEYYVKKARIWLEKELKK